MVEGVEELPPNLQAGAFRQPRILRDDRVPVIDSRAVEKSAAGGSEHAQGLLAEQAGVEIRLPRARIVESELPAQEVRRVDR